MTSRKSSPSSSRTKPPTERLERPFEESVWAEARRYAEKYRLILEPGERKGFLARALEFPTVFERGATVDECVANVRQALTVAAATMLEAGRRPPLPAASRRRQAQINIRLTAQEKLLLEESARAAGFRGVSDYVRARILATFAAAG